MASGKNVIEIEHILSVIYMMEDSYALYFLNLEGIDKRELLFTLCHEEGNVKSEKIEEKVSKNKGEQKSSNKSIIEKYTVNLNEFVKEQVVRIVFEIPLFKCRLMTILADERDGSSFLYWGFFREGP